MQKTEAFSRKVYFRLALAFFSRVRPDLLVGGEIARDLSMFIVDAFYRVVSPKGNACCENVLLPVAVCPLIIAD